MKSANYIVIQGWMCNELELKGNELLIFALIHGFSQDGVSKYYGGRKYIADTFNISLPTVDKALQGLLDKEYIVKHISGDYINPDSYWINLEVVKKLYEGSKETLLGGSKETLLNNTNKQIKEKKEVSKDTTEFLGSIKQKQLVTNQPKKDNLYGKCVALIDNYTSDQELRKALINYLRVRLEIKDKPLYVNSWKGLLNKLDRDFDAGERLQVVYQSIERGYASFFPVNNWKSSTYDVTKGKAWEENVSCKQVTKEEQEEIDRLNKEREAKGLRIKF